MKKWFIACALTLVVLTHAQAQNGKTLFGNNGLIQKASFQGMAFDFGYSGGELYKKYYNGFNIGVYVNLNNRLLTGIYMDNLVKHNPGLSVPASVNPVNPVFNLFNINWRNEILINPNSLVHFSLPIDFGLMNASFSDKYNRNSQGMNQVISDATFFGGSVGLNMGISMSKYLDMLISAKYRTTAGAERVGNDVDFTGPVYAASVRFKIPNE